MEDDDGGDGEWREEESSESWGVREGMRGCREKE
jgi:hypothetical protein